MLLKQSYTQSVADFYTTGLKDSDSTKLVQAIGNSFGDYQLTCPTILYGSAFAAFNKSNKAYAYRLTHPPTIHAFLDCKGWLGVCHGDDVILLFGFPIKLRGIGFDEQDFKLSNDMIHVWTTFAKTGYKLFFNISDIFSN